MIAEISMWFVCSYSNTYSLCFVLTDIYFWFFFVNNKWTAGLRRKSVEQIEPIMYMLLLLVYLPLIKLLLFFSLGSSTACIVVLDRTSHRLHTANLGDSGFLVVRGGEVVHRSDEQQHYFNTPFQLSIAPPEAEGVVLSDRWGGELIRNMDQELEIFSQGSRFWSLYWNFAHRPFNNAPIWRVNLLPHLLVFKVV